MASSAAEQLIAAEDAAAASAAKAAAKRAKKKIRQAQKKQTADGMTVDSDASSNKENIYTNCIVQRAKPPNTHSVSEQSTPQEAQASCKTLELTALVSADSPSCAEREQHLAPSAAATASTRDLFQDAASVQSLFCCPITKVSPCLQLLEHDFEYCSMKSSSLRCHHALQC